MEDKINIKGLIDNYYVQVIDSSAFVVKELGPFSKKKADKVDDGININLNHDEYYTVITYK